MKYTIRRARLEDLDRIVSLCADHAAYEKAAYSPAGKRAALQQHLFNNPEHMVCLVVVDSADLAVGYAFVTKDYSIWNAAHYAHMDCLYFDPPVRGAGIGKKIMEAIKLVAKEWGCSEVQWQTPVFNARGINFYRQLENTEEKEKIRFFWH